MLIQGWCQPQLWQSGVGEGAMVKGSLAGVVRGPAKGLVWMAFRDRQHLNREQRWETFLNEGAKGTRAKGVTLENGGLAVWPAVRRDRSRKGNFEQHPTLVWSNQRRTMGEMARRWRSGEPSHSMWGKDILSSELLDTPCSLPPQPSDLLLSLPTPLPTFPLLRPVECYGHSDMTIVSTASEEYYDLSV